MKFEAMQPGHLPELAQLYGSELLKELERQLLSMGIRKLCLFTSRNDNTEGFYQKRGFTRWDDMVMMGKTIQEE